MTAPPETALYGPVKALLEGQGYEVKGEIVGCDVVAVRGDEPPVIVELKRVFGLEVVLQGIDRLAVSDAVYVAVGAWPRRTADARTLCRRLGLGLIVVVGGARTSSSIPSRTSRGGTGGGRPGCSTSIAAGSAIRPAAARSGVRS